jgi:hypothetical protein
MGNSYSISRRDFLELMAAAATVLTFAPFDWGHVSAKRSMTLNQFSMFGIID